MRIETKPARRGSDVEGKTHYIAGDVATVFALAAVVWTSRAWLIGTWGSPVPFWDQWDVEGELYRAWLTDSLHLADLWATHNEHRILLTRVVDLVLFAVCGGWNPWAQLLLNATLHAACAGMIFAVFRRQLGPGASAVMAFGVALIFSATAGWQNALWGFQSQVYFTNFFAVVAFAGLATASPGTLRWGLAFGGLILAQFGNAGGLLAAIAALALTWPRSTTARAWTGWLAVLGLAMAGALLHVKSGNHETLRVQSVAQFAGVFSRCLGWPHVDSAWAWIVMQLPLVVLGLRRWRTCTPFSTGERLALALVGFGTLQAAAVAYSRGAGLPDLRPLSRYQDPLLLGTAGQLFAAVVLASEFGQRGRLLCLGWSAVALAGILQLTTTNLSLHLPYKRAQDAASLAQIRTYLLNGDASVLHGVTPYSGPHPDARVVQRVLDDPVLRSRLPATFFSPPDPGPIPRPWLVAQGGLLFAAAVVTLGLTLASSVRRSQSGRTR